MQEDTPTPAPETADDAAALDAVAELSRTVDQLQVHLLRACRLRDPELARRLLAGPLAIAAEATLDRLRVPDDEVR